MLDILLPLLFLVALIYGLHQLPKRLNAKRHSHRLTQPGEAGWTFEYSGRTLSLYTTAFNTVPRAIVSAWPPASKSIYDLGTAAATLGGLGAMGGALWALVEVWRAVWTEAREHAMQKAVTGEVMTGMRKRAVELLAQEAVAVDPKSLSGGLQPLIPGLTIPLSHLPTLVLTLFVNQLIHELGHAFAAAFEGITATRLSFNLHVLVPSMMVSFPGTVDTLPPPAKLRLASSGPWHNLITYLLIASLSLSGLGRIYWIDRGADGRVVQYVDTHSPLHSHISPGMLITHVDDVFVGGAEDAWSAYLQGTEVGDADRGWCIQRSTYQALSAPPCTGVHEITFERTIESKASGLQPKCLTPHPMLDVPSSPCPCPGSKWVCVRPAAAEHILRIQFESRNKHRQNVVLWSGDRKAVHEDVQVGTHSARVAGPVIRWGTLFLEYLSSIALSLFFFNLLPLPGTDGSQLLRALLSLIKPRTHASPTPTQKPFQATLSSSARINMPTINIKTYREYELSDDEDDGDEEEGRRGRREERWKTRLRKSVEAGSVAVLVGWIAGWGMLALLRSS